MSREAQVRFCERRGVRFPPPTLLVVLCPTRERAGQALAALAEILAGLGLALAPAKTSLVDLREPKAQTSGSFVMSKATTCGNAIEPYAEPC